MPEPIKLSPDIILTVFSTPDCPPCRGMVKAKIVEKMMEAYPNIIECRKIMLGDPENPKSAAFEDLGNKRDVDNVPCHVFDDAKTGQELFRIDAGRTFKQFENEYKEGIAALTSKPKKKRGKKR